MADADFTQLLMLVVGAISFGILASVIIWPFVSGENKTEKRIQSVTENRSSRVSRVAEAEDSNNRRNKVAEKLKELEEGQRAQEKVTLRLRLARAGLDVTPKVFWMVSMVSGVVVGLVVHFSFPGVHVLASVMAAFTGAFGLPRWLLSQAIKRRQKKFTYEFANAIDVIVRGVKSGLPVIECLGIIARESPQPIGGEFRDLVEQQRIGVPFSEAFERMIKRMPLPEVKFFAIVIGIQTQAGGNLSEALGNLSGVLRARKQMAAKVAALSSEAKASAAILAAMPFLVMSMVYLSTPAYISLLWTTKMGQLMLFVSGFWMTCGILVMKKMINFKY